MCRIWFRTGSFRIHKTTKFHHKHLHGIRYAYFPSKQCCGAENISFGPYRITVVTITKLLNLKKNYFFVHVLIKYKKISNRDPDSEPICNFGSGSGRLISATRLRLRNTVSKPLAVMFHLGNVHVYSAGLLVLGEENVHGCLRQGRQTDVEFLRLSLVPGLRLRCRLKWSIFIMLPSSLRLTSTELRLTSTELRLASTELRLTSTELRLASTELRLTSTELRLTSTELRLTSTELRLTPT